MAYARRDGRKVNETRKLSISFDGLARVDGSARFGFDDTTLALASISGPIEVRLAAEHPSQATFEVLLRPLSNISATDSKSLAATIRSVLTPSLILSQNPRTLIQLTIQSLSSPDRTWRDGLVAAMINASTLALLNAGSIPMRGVICAVSVGRLSSGAVLVVDPAEEEVLALEGGGCFAFLYTDTIVGEPAKCVWTNWKSTTGVVDEKEISEARRLAKGAADGIWSSMKISAGQMGSTPPFVFRGETKDDRKSKLSNEGGAALNEDDDDAKMEI